MTVESTIYNRIVKVLEDLEMKGCLMGNGHLVALALARMCAQSGDLILKCDLEEERRQCALLCENRIDEWQDMPYFEDELGDFLSEILKNTRDAIIDDLLNIATRIRQRKNRIP